MSMSTRESMRAELKELAKMAETMGKAPAAEAVDDRPLAFPENALERPPTPASASRVSVPPFATPTTPPVFDYAEPKKGGKRTAFIAVTVGAALAAALVGGAAVGKSFAGAPNAPVAPITAAAAIAPQAEVALPAAVSAPPPAAVAPPPVAAPVAPAPVAVAPKSSPSTPSAPAPHKHWAKPAGAAPAAAAAKPATASAPAANTDSDGLGAPAPKAAPAAAKPAKPAAAAAGGGTDSLEDLIRKEVANQKK